MRRLTLPSTSDVGTSTTTFPPGYLRFEPSPPRTVRFRFHQVVCLHANPGLDLAPETLVESAANQNAKDTLLAKIGSGETALFAGAGVSVPSGFPPWPKLLEDLEAMCDSVAKGFVRDDKVRVDDPLVYADAIKAYVETHTGNFARYEAELAKCFGAAPLIQPFHEDLVSLPFRGFLTTNYERTLETALALSEPEPSEKSVVVGVDHASLTFSFVRSLASQPRGRLVAHIHGWYKQPSSIILSASDYARAYGLRHRREAALLPEFLKIAVAPVSFVFVGFSFNDQHFRNFLSAAGDRFALWGTNAHYAVIPTSVETADRDAERAVEYKERFAIETIFYERIGTSHQQLFDLIGSFREKIGLTKRRAAVVDFNDRMVEGMCG